MKHQVMSASPPNWPEECARLVCRPFGSLEEVLFANLRDRLRQSNCIIKFGGFYCILYFCCLFESSQIHTAKPLHYISRSLVDLYYINHIFLWH